MTTTDNGKYKNKDCLKLLRDLVHKRNELYRKRYDDSDNEIHQQELIITIHGINEILSYINTNYIANITDEIADVYGLELDNIRQVYIMHGQLVFEHENKRGTINAIPVARVCYSIAVRCEWKDIVNNRCKVIQSDDSAFEYIIIPRDLGDCVLKGI